MPAAEPGTVRQWLAWLLAQGLERLDSQLLVLHAMDHPASDRSWLLAHDSDPLNDAAATVLRATARRRVGGEPLAYITGQKEFFGILLGVDARVLVPRPDTETLVEWALDLLPADSCARVIDLGTGSGAIALALKSNRPGLHMFAIDTSADALSVARANAQRLGLKVQFSQDAWLAGVTDRFDVIVSNPPYIGIGDPHLAHLTHEPLQALTSGGDGLDDIHAIIAQASAHLLPGGWLLLEHGYDQATVVRGLLAHAGFDQVQTRHDLAGLERCSGGCLPPCAE